MDSKYIVKLTLLFIVMPYFSIAQHFKEINAYKVSYSVAVNNQEAFIGLRSFEDEANHQYLLLVNPETLEIKIDLAAHYKISNSSMSPLLEGFRKTVYCKTLLAASLNNAQLQNAGINSIKPSQSGINLTIDLCPSTKPLDRDIFQSIFTEFKKVEQPAPVSISVSGKWILKHVDDLNWLKSLMNNGELNITWINHTYHHEVNKLPLKENFLLTAGTDLNIEILENEKLMLKNGLVPSVFFRFPGLVSDSVLVNKIEDYGLIPIGSDAWLAKGQLAKNGSIVLIHGNGNEEIGVKDFIELLRQNKLKVENHSWRLLDLRTSLDEEY